MLEGWYVWEVNGEIRRVNVLDLARQNGQLATIDPAALNILTKISNATKTEGVRVLTSDPLVDNYVWQSPGKLFERQPTVKLDYNLTERHRLSGSYSILWADRKPDYLNSEDSQFPGAPNWEHFRSRRPLSSIALRSTLSSNLVNEFRVGMTALGGASKFGQPDDPSSGPGSFDDIGGSAIVIPLTTDWFTSTGASWRSVPTFSFDNSISWQRGSHSLNMGAGILHSGGYENAQTIVQTINLGFDTAQRPGGGPVHQRELSRRGSRRRARRLRDADRPHLVDHGTGGARSGDQPIRRVRAAGSRGVHPAVFGVRAGSVARQADPDAHHGPPL